MRPITLARIERNRPQPQTHAEHLRSLAQRVERLAVSGRTDPEIVVLEKHSLARDMRRLARVLEVTTNG